MSNADNLHVKSWRMKQCWNCDVSPEGIGSYPYVLYFHGQEMPKWSNIWPEVPIEPDTEPYLSRILYKIDNEGSLLSESAPIFIIAAQCVLIALVEHRREYLEAFGELGDSPLVIYNNLVIGLAEMIKIAEMEDVVFWANGSPSIKDCVISVIDRYNKMTSRNTAVIPPHLGSENAKLVSTINIQRNRLRKLSNQKALEETHRKLLNSMNEIEILEFCC